MSPSLALGAGAAVGLYLAGLVAVGYATRRRGAQTGLGDFYLAGRNLGGFVLLLTLYATQYSGNTLLGYPGEAFRIGYAWVMSVGFMMAIIVVYLLFAPRLQRLARRHAFVTPGDWITHRFGSPRLTLLANVLLVAAISNYLLAQLMAMGHVTEGLSGGAVPYWAGVVLLTLVVIVYETVGGMRAVAWTDCVQGLMLLVGLAGLLLAVVPTPGHLAELTAAVAAAAPEKAAVPPPEVSRNWLSTLLLIGFSGAVYPHAVQRIYAARNAATLKRAFSVMVFLPLVTTGVMFLVGILAIRDLPAAGDADQVMPALLTAWSSRSVLLYLLCVVVITAVVAAVMSTADSVLLSLSSILAKDVLGTTLLRGAPEETLTRAGKLLSWGVVGVLVVIALAPRVTLWGLTEIKMEILAQVAPLFVLGVTWRRLTTTAAFAGMLAGCATYGGLLVAGHAQVWNVHAGVVGLGVNVAICAILTRLSGAAGARSRPAGWPARGARAAGL
ncbi:MAG: sodium:solute symporter family protein [Acidobacteria bacterium]|nr:sodium:solute symporter family protein [Acidobacteriota bacterium]